MDCPRCHAPATEEMLQEFGGVCPKCLLAFAAERDAPSFPNLEIIEMIGQGGMGVVYRALQKNLNRTVALKVLSPKFSDDPEFLGRFTREAQALAQLSHPNIVAIHDSGVHDRVPYLVMEYVDGRSLRALLQSREITVAQVLSLIPQICDALQYAHARGVVHRDIKPENILVDAQGRVKIADYGLAKLAGAQETRLTKSGYTMGTPHYMAPEQVENSSEVDHRADIYSLGVIFYEMLTGELPLGRFKAPSEKGSGDRRLDPVVLKSLEKEPADRYQSAGEVKAQLAHLDKVPPAAAFVSYSKVAVASGVVSLLTVAFFLLFLVFVGTRDPAAGAFGMLSGVSLVAAFGLSIAGIAVTSRSRGALRGGWIAVTALIFSILSAMLGMGGLLFVPASGPQAPTRPAVTVPAPRPEAGSTAFHLADAWPRPEELPAGLTYESVLEGAEAFREVPAETREADGSRTIRRGAQYRDMLPDLVLGRMATLANGGVRVIGLEFKTEYARKRWERECRLYPVLVPDRGNPEGKSLFIVKRTQLEEMPAASAAIDVLIPLLQRKMARAASVYRE